MAMPVTRSHAVRRRLGAVACAGALSVIGFWPGRAALADSVETVGGEIVSGVVLTIAKGKVTLAPTENAAAVSPLSASPGAEDKLLSAILGDDAKKTALPPQPKKLREIPLVDVVAIHFDPVFDRARHYPPLIDNEPAGGGRTVSGTIKLRAGYHRIVLPYWHGSGRALLRLSYCLIGRHKERPLRLVPRTMLFHLGASGTEIPSPGLDREGYRVAEKLGGEVTPGLTSTVRRQPAGRAFQRMGDMLLATSVVSNGTLDRVSARSIPEDGEQVALLIVGYFQIPKDGEYEFQLSSDGGSQLYFGETPSGLRFVDASPPPAPWTVTLVDGGRLSGSLGSWSDSKVTLGLIVGRSPVMLSLPVERIAEIWSNKVLGKEDKIDRSPLPGGPDVVYARSAGGSGSGGGGAGRPLQRVGGRLRGIDGQSLVLEFGGEDRKISLAKVAGVVLAGGRGAVDANSAAAPVADRKFYQVLETYSGLKVPGELTSLDSSSADLRTLWGDKLTFQTDDLTSLSIQNGKVVRLTELTPAHVEQVPFFDRLIPFRVNESLSGGPIVLRDGKHLRGISVHARTVLRYEIGGRFQRFHTRLGFQLPEGEQGDAAVRILGDDKPLFERSNLRGDDPVEAIDVDVSGVHALTLSVDFGRREDVGDRVVWADPTLVRADVGR